MGKVLGWLIIIAVGGWFLLGSPKNTLADMFWKDSAAPWETVDAFFCPNKSVLTVHTAMKGFAGLEGCRAWVKSQAASIGDPMMERSDYECGIGKIKDFGEITMYRATSR